MRRGDHIRIGIASDDGWGCSYAFGRAVPLPARLIPGIELYQLSEIHIRAESPFHSVNIRPESIAANLRAASNSPGKIVHKSRGVAAAPLSDYVAQNEFRFSINCNKGVLIADASVINSNVFLFAVDEAPTLIDLDLLHGYIPNLGIEQLRCSLASFLQKSEHGFLM
jgi:hypothetical protein